MKMEREEIKHAPWDLCWRPGIGEIPLEGGLNSREKNPLWAELEAWGHDLMWEEVRCREWGASIGCAGLGSYNVLGKKALERVRDIVLLVKVQMNSLATSSSFWTSQVCFQTLGVWKKPFISLYDRLCCRTFVYRGPFLWATGESEHLKLRVWLLFIEYLGH